MSPAETDSTTTTTSTPCVLDYVDSIILSEDQEARYQLEVQSLRFLAKGSKPWLAV